MTITRETQLEIIGYMAATSGREQTYLGQSGNISSTSRVLSVPVAIVREDDERTEVEVFEDGSMEITGWNGTEGLGDDVCEFSDAEIEKLYNALYGLV